MAISFLCNICEKPVGKNHKTAKCANWKLWVHIKINKTNKQIYKNLLMKETLLGTVSSVQNLFFPSITLTITNIIPLYRAKK